MLIDVNKKYTKDEFVKLKESECGVLIATYDILYENGESKMFDYYMESESARENLKIGDYDEKNSIGYFTLIKLKNINELLDEAEDRVWFARHGFQDIKSKEIREENQNNSYRIVKKYNIKKYDNMSSFDYGYWSGI